MPYSSCSIKSLMFFIIKLYAVYKYVLFSYIFFFTSSSILFRQKVLLILVCENKLFSLKISCVITIYDYEKMFNLSIFITFNQIVCHKAWTLPVFLSLCILSNGFIFIPTIKRSTNCKMQHLSWWVGGK